MLFYRLKPTKIFICLLLVLTCFISAGCLKVESHREPLPETTTPEPSAPVVDNRPRVALTFDDGPHNVRTKKIVDELDKYGYHATFFVVGNRVDGTAYSGGAAMVYAAEHGNEIGIHGYTHETSISYSSCSDERYEYEISNTLQAIQEKLPGYEVRVMRPFGGSISGTRAAQSPFAVVNWNVDTLDYANKYDEGDPEKINIIVENALSDIDDGDIILMHDIYNNTYEATVIILARLYEMGFNVVTVSELLGDEWCPGVRYTHGPKGAQ